MDDTRVFIVRTTTGCNLACSYCYVHDKTGARITLATVARLIAQSAALPEDTIVFVWHGGEPLLMGLPFFEAVVGIQKKYKKHFINAVQTNGIGLTPAFVRFFSEHSFRVAVSVDVPLARHNENRRFKNGRTGSSEIVEQRLALLRQYGMPVSVLGVVTDLSLDAEAYLDFVARIQPDSLALNLEFDIARTRDAAAASRYAAALSGLYRHCAEHDDSLTLREADTIIEHIRHLPSSYCWHQKEFCGHHHTAVSETGDIFICCDKFIDSPWSFAKLGNINTDQLNDIFASTRFNDLMRSLAAERAACASDCRIGRFCRGGCIHDALMSRHHAEQRGEQIGCQARASLLEFIQTDFGVSP